MSCLAAPLSAAGRNGYFLHDRRWWHITEPIQVVTSSDSNAQVRTSNRIHLDMFLYLTFPQFRKSVIYSFLDPVERDGTQHATEACKNTNLLNHRKGIYMLGRQLHSQICGQMSTIYSVLPGTDFLFFFVFLIGVSLMTSHIFWHILSYHYTLFN